MTTAERAAAAMWENDQASEWFGFQLVSVAEGTATLSLTVQSHHCNGHGILHGGVTFSLADSAFAFACNSRNQKTVAQHNSISFLAPGFQGDTLTAVATERQLHGKSGIYDVQVTKGDGTTIAEFRGHSRAIPGTLFEDSIEATQ